MPVVIYNLFNFIFFRKKHNITMNKIESKLFCLLVLISLCISCQGASIDHLLEREARNALDWNWPVQRSRNDLFYVTSNENDNSNEDRQLYDIIKRSGFWQKMKDGKNGRKNFV